MRAHIFTHVGRWRPSVDTNRRSANASRAGGEVGDELHAIDYVVYAYLQTAQDSGARKAVEDLGGYRKVVEDLGGYPRRVPGNRAIPFALASMPEHSPLG